MKILSVENLSRSFGGIKANDNISFEVEEGTILGVIGPQTFPIPPRTVINKTIIDISILKTLSGSMIKIY